MSTPNKPDAIIFDFDGTLADTFRLSLSILYELAHHVPLPPENMSVLRGMTVGQVVHRLSVSKLHALLLWRAANRAIARRASDIELVADVAAMLRSLSQLYPLYIVTANRATTVATVLARYRLTDCFVAVRGGANPFRKAGALRRMAQRHGLADKTVWYVGDQASDVLAARHADMHSAAVTWGFNNLRLLEAASPELLAFTPAELLHFFHADDTTN